MILEELREVEMYVFVSPEGVPQLCTLALEFAYVIGFTEMLADAGLSKHPAVMISEGFQVLPVKMTMVANGTAEEGYARAREKLLKPKK